MIDLFEKCYKPGIADDAKARGIYPYFHALESKQDVTVIMEGKRRIMLGSFVVFRQIYLYIVSHFITNTLLPLAMGYPAGWLVCSAATLLYYRRAALGRQRLVEDN